MKNVPAFAVVCFLIMLLSGCTRNEFTVEFKLPENSDANYRLLYYASDSKKGAYVEAAAPVTHGRFTLKCIARNPSLVYVLRDGSAPTVFFVAHRGDKIEITGESIDALEWTITGGGDENKAISRWRIDNIENLRNRDGRKINESLAALVKREPDSPATALLLMNYYDRTIDRDGYDRLWAKLGKEAITEEVMMMTPGSDLHGGEPSPRGNLMTLALTTFPTGADTIIPSKAKATILYFRRHDDSFAEEDTIRAIATRWSDSLSRHIVEITLDSDSLEWARRVRNDSVRKIVKAWVPLGFADQRVMQLGVESTPYYIVADKKGKRAYSGSDREEAAKAFRRLMTGAK